jgi:hypothetical protein
LNFMRDCCDCTKEIFCAPEKLLGNLRRGCRPFGVLRKGVHCLFGYVDSIESLDEL